MSSERECSVNYIRGLFLILPVLCLSACGTTSQNVAPAGTAAPTPRSSTGFTVALVTDVGGLHDKSFNQLANSGLETARRRDGIGVQVQESRSESDYVPDLTRFAREHAGLTVAVGYLMGSAVYTAASAYPKARFAILDGAPSTSDGTPYNLPNVTNIFFKEQESGYLAGALAGLMELHRVGRATHNTIAYMGGLAIPPVIRYLAGFEAGARHVDPSIVIQGAYSQSFSDVNKGKSIALSQIHGGADILFGVAGASGLGYIQAAHDRGVYGIGIDADQSYLGPYVLTSAIKRVDVALRLVVRRAIRGRFSGGDQRLGLRQGATGYARPSRVVPADIDRQVRALAGQIAKGVIVPPTTFAAR